MVSKFMEWTGLVEISLPRSFSTSILCLLQILDDHGMNIFQCGCTWCLKVPCKASFMRHGGSDGLHAYVHSLDDAVNDMKLFLSKVLAENPGLPCFCFGHSTGGAIILKTVLDPKVKQHLAGIVLTSPAIGVQPSHPIFAVLAPVFSFLFPRFQFSAANKRGVAVSRDPDALVAKYSDPLVFTGAIRVRTGYEILRITAYLQQNLSRLAAPFLVLHGSDDSVSDPEASQKLYKEASSSDKNIMLYEGLLHDLLFEREKEEIMENIISWLNSRV
ncbi:monoacylglycerol lipase-like isoform X2 [Salvia hispanica]|uniref:monoacylglycerol lipase-like isoform X2 n=1 Tax=Salvia hispanica TaxID=49212 RepID=UPI002009195C|nr:monoacylglycerol lipase-like isoform X2 [Salvia hispanica]